MSIYSMYFSRCGVIWFRFSASRFVMQEVADSTTGRDNSEQVVYTRASVNNKVNVRTTIWCYPKNADVIPSRWE